ncbi:hypothetical protein Syun_014306 [Stephania yunnanensis]|uniref:Protein kinase domain-containing protein n=1 Tax=Stephania yunnanensis TaxID=152371 RepID=A0AAP0JJ35_9MAGN
MGCSRRRREAWAVGLMRYSRMSGAHIVACGCQVRISRNERDILEILSLKVLLRGVVHWQVSHGTVYLRYELLSGHLRYLPIECTLGALIRVCGYLIVARVRVERLGSRPKPESVGLLPRLNDLWSGLLVCVDLARLARGSHGLRRAGPSLWETGVVTISISRCYMLGELSICMARRAQVLPVVWIWRRSRVQVFSCDEYVFNWFKLDELKTTRDNFSMKNLIWQRSVGIVYKGILSDGTLVAVKNIIESHFQGDRKFVYEVEIISNLRHMNIVLLRGCYVVNNDDYDLGEEQKQKYFVYDYMPNENLNDHLFLSKNDEKSTLSWPRRKNIILNVAKGLAYLHYGIKDGQSHLTTRVIGTFGYLAPEYDVYGQLTENSDVYSFGIVVLEIISGRKALDLSSSDTNRLVLITDWVWQLVKLGRIEEVLDAFA